MVQGTYFKFNSVVPTMLPQTHIFGVPVLVSTLVLMFIKKPFLNHIKYLEPLNNTKDLRNLDSRENKKDSRRLWSPLLHVAPTLPYS